MEQLLKEKILLSLTSYVQDNRQDYAEEVYRMVECNLMEWFKTPMRTANKHIHEYEVYTKLLEVEFEKQKSTLRMVLDYFNKDEVTVPKELYEDVFKLSTFTFNDLPIKEGEGVNLPCHVVIDKGKVKVSAGYLQGGLNFSADKDSLPLLIDLIKTKEGEGVPDDFEKVTGHKTPQQMAAYEKGREHEERVFMKFIKEWDGKTNSHFGQAMKDTFERLKSEGEGVSAERLYFDNVEYYPSPKLFNPEKEEQYWKQIKNITISLMKQYASQFKSPEEGVSKDVGEWQLCPKCNGTGFIYNPHAMTTQVTDLCDVCNGSKIIAKPVLQSTLLVEGEQKEYIGDKIKKEMKGYHIYNHPAKKMFDAVCWRLYGQTFDTLCSNEGNQQSGFWLDIILPAMEEYKSEGEKEDKINEGWDCPDSPTGYCDYEQEDGSYNEDCCKYCGNPEERK